MIPRRLVRVVPEQTTDEVERWWAEACALHPSWEHVTLRDPIDPSGFPETSPLWDQVCSGAQLADLVRYEELYWRGGVYIDSDVQLFKPLDSLMSLGGFAAWEDRNAIPNAVLGFEPYHYALARILTKAKQLMPGPVWPIAVGVVTEVLKNRHHDDVLVLPPDSFYPIHWQHKVLLKSPGMVRSLRENNPWTFGLHWWHYSWEGTGT